MDRVSRETLGDHFFRPPPGPPKRPPPPLGSGVGLPVSPPVARPGPPGPPVLPPVPVPPVLHPMSQLEQVSLGLGLGEPLGVAESLGVADAESDGCCGGVGGGVGVAMPGSS